MVINSSKNLTALLLIHFSFSGVSSESESELEVDRLEIDIQVASPALSSDSTLLSEDGVVSPISKPSFNYPPSSLPSEEFCSELSAGAEVPQSESKDSAEAIYLEQRDHTYLSKKQLPYLAANHVSSGPRLLNTHINKTEQKTTASVSSRPGPYTLRPKVLKETAPANPAVAKDSAAAVNPAALQEHGYGINYAEEQQENIRRDHNYGYTPVLKGRKLSKFRKSVRANTQSNNLDHSYELLSSK